MNLALRSGFGCRGARGWPPGRQGVRRLVPWALGGPWCSVQACYRRRRLPRTTCLQLHTLCRRVYPTGPLARALPYVPRRTTPPRGSQIRRHRGRWIERCSPALCRSRAPGCPAEPPPRREQLPTRPARPRRPPPPLQNSFSTTLAVALAAVWGPSLAPRLQCLWLSASASPAKDARGGGHTANPSALPSQGSAAPADPSPPDPTTFRPPRGWVGAPPTVSPPASRTPSTKPPAFLSPRARPARGWPTQPPPPPLPPPTASPPRAPWPRGARRRRFNGDRVGLAPRRPGGDRRAAATPDRRPPPPRATQRPTTARCTRPSTRASRASRGRGRGQTRPRARRAAVDARAPAAPFGVGGVPHPRPRAMSIPAAAPPLSAWFPVGTALSVSSGSGVYVTRSTVSAMGVRRETGLRARSDVGGGGAGATASPLACNWTYCRHVRANTLARTGFAV